MAELSIQLNRVGVGSSYLDAADLYTPHKQNAEESLAKIFESHIPDHPKKEFSLDIRMRPGKASLHMEDREIPLCKSKEIKRIDQIVRYYQHTGHLSREEIDPQVEAALTSETKKSVKAINQATVPGANGNLLAGMRLADDTLSLTRNILFSLPPIGKNDPIASHLGYYGGIFWTFFAIRELEEGLVELERSKMIGDIEGKRRGKSRVLSGSIITAASLTYLGGKICNNFVSASAATTLLGAANVLYGAGSLLSVGVTLLGAVRCDRFNKRLNEYLDNTKLTESERMRGAIQFLKDSISVTPEEKEELATLIAEEHPDWPQEKRDQLFFQKLADLTETKVKYVKRRTSNKSLREILRNADQILGKLRDPDRVSEGIRDASLLIHTVQKENKIKMSLYLLGFIASLISVVAMAILIASPGAILPFILYAIAVTIYLSITVYSIAGILIKRDADTELSDLNLIQNLSHIS